MRGIYKREGKRIWYASYVDETGRSVNKSTRTTNANAALRIRNQWQAEAALRREGVIDPTLDAIGKEAARSIESHLVDYKNKLKADSRKTRYIRETMAYIRKIAADCSFTSADSIKADLVSRFVNRLQADNKSARTIQANLTAIKGFTRWLANNHKLHRDPLSSIKKPNPGTDRRYERRMLLPDEWTWLVYTLANTPARYGMPADERHLLYLTAIQTGLRVSELRSLTRGRLHLDSETPYIICKADSTKNKKEAKRYIGNELAAKLNGHIATKAIQTPVFALPNRSKVPKMLREDLAEARSQWLREATNDPQEYALREQSDFLLATNDEGHVLDFHALRHTCGAWLAKDGVDIKTIQKILGHSTITLTMDTYGHVFPGDEAEAGGKELQRRVLAYLRHTADPLPRILLLVAHRHAHMGGGGEVDSLVARTLHGRGDCQRFGRIHAQRSPQALIAIAETGFDYADSGHSYLRSPRAKWRGVGTDLSRLRSTRTGRVN